MKRFFIGLLSSLFFSLYGVEIAVVTLAAGGDYKNVVQQGIDNKYIYCKKHGYDFVCGDKVLDPSRPIPWSKIQILLQTMENSEYKWIFWTDADSLVMNQAIGLESLIDENYNLIIAKDLNGINSGQFLIKNCAWSRQFLRDVYAHTECIHHPHWEQEAIILEFNEKPDVVAQTKLIPQRLFNSYPEERFALYGLTTVYQPGDFILHFPTAGDNLWLRSFFDKYAPLSVDDPTLLSLDHYLGIYGFQLSPLDSAANEGYMTQMQKSQFNHALEGYQNIRRVAEVGLNGGHSAENFFTKLPQLERFTSFDIQLHAYTQAAKEYLTYKYEDIFEFIQGDSMRTVPEYAASHPEVKFDLIYIDGSHRYENCLQDIVNFHHLAASHAILWVDDYCTDVQRAVEKCVQEGIVEILNIHSSADPLGGRIWVEARYIQNN